MTLQRGTSAMNKTQERFEQRPPRRRRSLHLERYAALVFFAILIAVFSGVEGPAFTSWDNITTTLAQSAHFAFLAAAVTVTLIAGQFDLSIGSLAGLAAVLSAVLTTKAGWGFAPTALVVIAVGLVAGLVNGLLVTKLKLNAFIATLGSGGVMLGIAMFITNEQTVYGTLPPAFGWIGSTVLLGIPVPVYIAALLLLVTWLLTRHTVIGRYWYAVGANPEAARLAGVKTESMVIAAFMTTGLLGALGGILFVARYGSADSSAGPGWLLPVFASAFLGSAILSDGRFTVLGSVIATFILEVVANAMQVAGWNVAVIQAFNGAVLIAAVAVGATLRSRSRRHGGRSKEVAALEEELDGKESVTQ